MTHSIFWPARHDRCGTWRCWCKLLCFKEDT